MSSVLRTMTEMSLVFKGKNRVAPSVTAPGDTNLSDVTASNVS